MLREYPGLRTRSTTGAHREGGGLFQDYHQRTPTSLLPFGTANPSPFASTRSFPSHLGEPSSSPYSMPFLFYLPPSSEEPPSHQARANMSQPAPAFPHLVKSPLSLSFLLAVRRPVRAASSNSSKQHIAAAAVQHAATATAATSSIAVSPSSTFIFLRTAVADAAVQRATSAIIATSSIATSPPLVQQSAPLPPRLPGLDHHTFPFEQPWRQQQRPHQQSFFIQS